MVKEMSCQRDDVAAMVESSLKSFHGFVICCRGGDYLGDGVGPCSVFLDGKFYSESTGI